MKEEEHEHKWTTRYVIYEWNDYIQGMECKCGETLEQDEIEDIVNKAYELKDICF